MVDNQLDINKDLIDGFQTAAIDVAYQSNPESQPEFLSNNYPIGPKVLDSIDKGLKSCDEFKISVAFIKESGITPLKQTLKDLEERGIHGKILTTDYLFFSEPKALDILASLKNIELRMFRTSNEIGGFHTKGYIFHKEDLYRIIIGSSNLTHNAITRNREWNTKFVSTKYGVMTQDILHEFDKLWNARNTQSYFEFIQPYKLEYQRRKELSQKQKTALQDEDNDFDQGELVPNSMQNAFKKKILELWQQNVHKALLTSSTGTGKTAASAFAIRELHPNKVLFVVHREQIAKQALNSYKRIFGNSKTYGLLSGTSRNIEGKDCIFSTIQMMTKSDIHEQFKKDEFDVIVLDECHHAGSESYQRIMNYFNPQFWLGMTASPDTNNYDIYDLFDHNIAYEIRLQQAMEEDLLCPFHYFGITDLEINGEVFDDNAGVRNFVNLVSDARVDYVLEKAEYFGYSGNRVKGLIFCSRKEEAKELSLKFNLRHKKDGELYKTEVLTGEDSQERREEVIEKLTSDNDSGEKIDYIFTVDIFNEGVDIPEVNQVIMLRPTESPVVFIQQLGRGLRKYKGKEYVVILDFIGNYMNNFMIPIALSGDRSYNKDTIRRYVQQGSSIIPGASTIHFDEISRKRIYASIDKARTNEIKLLRDSYTALKYKLGKIPKISDFKEHGSIDITKIFDKCGSYYAFLKKYEPDYKCRLSETEETIIEYISKKLVSYKRIHDIALLKSLINQEDHRMRNYREFMKTQYGLSVSSVTEESVYRNLTNEFPKEEERKTYDPCILVKRTDEGDYILSPEFQKMLGNLEFKDMVLNLLNFAEDRYLECYSTSYRNTNFQLYQKYTYEDVCRLLNWKRNMNAQNIGGYFYDADTKTLPVFINYEKTDDAIAYEDRFVSENVLIALSKHPRKITSSDVTHIYKKTQEDLDNHIFLFMRKNKNDDEAKQFYFLGEIFAEGEPNPIHMESTNDDAFEIQYRLETPVKRDIYDYIVED